MLSASPTPAEAMSQQCGTSLTQVRVSDGLGIAHQLYVLLVIKGRGESVCRQ